MITINRATNYRDTSALFGPRPMFLSAYQRNGNIRLSKTLFEAMGQPTSVELTYDKPTGRLWIMASTSPDAWPLRVDHAHYNYTFVNYAVVRAFFPTRSRIEVSITPTRDASGQERYEILIGQPELPTRAARLHPTPPTEATTQAALELAEWIVRNRPTSFLKQADIHPESREILMKSFS